MASKHFLFAVLALSLFLTPLVHADGSQPTQITNRLFFQPFYRASIPANTNVSYSLAINPPDGFNSVSSAIVTLDVYMSPTVTFTLWINNQSCNNPSYVISTTFSGAGQARAYFDCSNTITKAGNYTATLRSTSLTGSSTLQVDLTFINNPRGNFILSGTEYQVGDDATIWLQLTDSQQIAISNASCKLDIYYPLSNGTHPYTVSDAPMLSTGKDDGIYYYDLIAPSQLGVYMLSAKCSYPFNQYFLYEKNFVQAPNESVQSGTWSGSTIAINNPFDQLYENCHAGAAVNCVANYTWNVSGLNVNASTASLYWSGSSAQNPNMTFFLWNGTAFNQLTNTLLLAGDASSTNPAPTDQYITNNLPLSGLINGGLIKIKVSAVRAASIDLWQNWLAISLFSSEGSVQQLKGSSEMHVTQSNASNVTITALAPYFQPLYGNMSYVLGNLTLVQQNQQAAMTALQGNFTLLHASIIGNVTALNNSFNAQFNYLNANLISNFSALNASDQARFDSLNATLASIQTQTTIMNAAITRIELNIAGNFTNVLANQQTILSDLATVQTSLNTLSATTGANFTAQNATLTSIINTLAGLSNVQNNINGNLTNFSSSLSTINISISNLSAILANVTGQLGDLTNISAQLTAIQSQLTTFQNGVSDELDILDQQIKWVIQRLQKGLFSIA
jgi:hypothetical protein